jgi:hypothetical protein
MNEGKQKDRKLFEEFTVHAIESLRTPPWKGIHTTFSGFKDAACDYFGEIHPVTGKKVLLPVETFVEWLKDLQNRKIIESHPSYRGALIYLYGERPKKTREITRGRTTLRQLGYVG